MRDVKPRLKSGDKPSLKGIERGKTAQAAPEPGELLLAFRQFTQILENQA